MKALRFIINTHLLIGAAAVSLAMATQVQLGLPPRLNAGLLLIFLSTLANYNLHRLLAVYKHADATQTSKLSWATKNSGLLLILTTCPLAGITLTLFYVKTAVLFLLVPLAAISIMYSVFTRFNALKTSWLFSMPGTKTIMLALAWASATVLIPALQANIPLNNEPVMLVFLQRLSFIIAIAIPFDIRDMESDTRAGIPTIPATFGVKRALLTSNLALLFSAIPPFYQYLCCGVTFIAPASLVSLALILFIINHQKLPRLPLYYHGILDGSILIHSLIIILSFYLIF